jgi:uncharacterized protein YecE (DUF72 family)
VTQDRARRAEKPQLRIGISGWTYARWRGSFYPQGLVQKRELEYASRQMNTIEINGSFYSLQRPTSYKLWYEQTPDDFVFAVKGGRFITHMKKLKDVEAPLANFFASGILLLAEKLGPILWQFPPQMRYDHEKFARFLELLPTTADAAAKLASRHDDRLEGRAWTEAEHTGVIRHAFEIRHDSFLEPAFVELLRAHNAALCFADTAGLWPYAEDLTSDFVYIRLHGAEKLYTSGYTDEQLAWWAERIRAWRRGSHPNDARTIQEKSNPKTGAGKVKRDVYVYFDNDAKVHAPFDAIRLAMMMNEKGKRGNE